MGFEIVEFVKMSDGRVKGLRRSYRKGPIILPDRRAQYELEVPYIVRLYQPEGRNVQFATPIHDYPSHHICHMWEVCHPAWNLFLAGDKQNIVIFSLDNSFIWDSLPLKNSIRALRVVWLDAEETLGVGYLIGDPLLEYRQAYRDASSAYHRLLGEITQKVEAFTARRLSEEEEAGRISFTFIEEYADWHPFKEDYEPWAPPLPPNATKHVRKVPASGHDVIDQVEEEAKELRSKLTADVQAVLDRYSSEMEAIQQKLNSFCDDKGLPHYPLY